MKDASAAASCLVHFCSQFISFHILLSLITESSCYNKTRFFPVEFLILSFSGIAARASFHIKR